MDFRGGAREQRGCVEPVSQLLRRALEPDAAVGVLGGVRVTVTVGVRVRVRPRMVEVHSGSVPRACSPAGGSVHTSARYRPRPGKESSHLVRVRVS